MPPFKNSRAAGHMLLPGWLQNNRVLHAADMHC
jgi:hypothetical protein